jgi:hypothetical protein
MSDYPGYEHNFTKAVDRGDGRDGASNYAAKKHVQMLYHRHHLAHDESFMKKLVGKGSGVYDSEDAKGMSRKRSCELGIAYIEKLLQREICQNRGQRTALPGLGHPSSSAQDTPRDDGRSNRPSHTRGPESCSGTECSGYAPESRLGTDRSAAGH